ncbi:MAG: carboxypeptidase regulatory-like domain-containing protein, partial [Bacteroidales bacterium]|nr:carboxypeptidase regulatory-like domain-containing protein [Bacteroidales bacterium]
MKIKIYFLLFISLTLSISSCHRKSGDIVFSVNRYDGKPVKNAVVTLDGVTNAPGDYIFNVDGPGIKEYSVTKDGYDNVGGQYCKVEFTGEPVQVNVIMQLNDDIDLTNLLWYNQNIFCKFVNGVLSMSTDYGKTYTYSIDISEIAGEKSDIKTLWIFEDLELFFADLTRCFYSHDWKTWHESTVYDIDGNIFKPNPEDHNFSRMSYHNNRPIIGDRELYIWGNYSTG